MWKTLFELVRQVLRLAEDTQRTRSDLKEIQKEVRDLAHKAEHEMLSMRREFGSEVRVLREAVDRLGYEIARVGESNAAERQKLVIQLENQLLRFERRLLLSKSADENDEES